MLPGLLIATSTASFGVHGFALGPPGRALGVVIDGADRVVLAGYAKEDRERAILLRYLPDGSLDSSFGRGGVVRLDTKTSGDDRFLGVALDRSKRIVASGSLGQDAGGARSVIARFLEDGGIDSTFGSGGVVVGREGSSFLYERAPGDGLDRFEAVEVDSKGRIVVAGAARGHRPSPRWGGTILCAWFDFGFCWSGETTTLVARFLEDGRFDEAFATSGYVIGKRGGRWHAGAHDELLDVKLLDDQILAVGWAAGATYDDERTILVRFREDGLFDETFAAGGFELSAPGSFAGGTKEVAYGVAIGEPIVVAAFSFDTERHIVALTKTYDLSGKLVAHTIEAPQALAGSDIEYFVKAAILPDGDVVCVGFTDDEWAYDGDVDRALLAVYSKGGERRASFSSHRDGRSVISGEKDDAFHDVAVDAHGRIYAVGTADHRVLAARFVVGGSSVSLR